MNEYFLFFIATILLALAIRGVSPREIYLIWYVFSFSLLLFTAVQYIIGQSDGSIIKRIDPFYVKWATDIYNYLTNTDDEINFVKCFVYITVAPQLLAYILSGLSRSAIAPVFVGYIRTIAVLSLVKYLACLSGIQFSGPLASYFLGHNFLGHTVSLSSFQDGYLTLVSTFALSAFNHSLSLPLSGVFSFGIGSFISIKLKLPVLLILHRFFTGETDKSVTAHTNDDVHTDNPLDRTFSLLTTSLIIASIRFAIPNVIAKPLVKYRKLTLVRFEGDGPHE